MLILVLVNLFLLFFCIAIVAYYTEVLNQQNVELTYYKEILNELVDRNIELQEVVSSQVRGGGDDVSPSLSKVTSKR